MLAEYKLDDKKDLQEVFQCILSDKIPNIKNRRIIINTKLIVILEKTTF